MIRGFTNINAMSMTVNMIIPLIRAPTRSVIGSAIAPPITPPEFRFVPLT